MGGAGEEEGCRGLVNHPNFMVLNLSSCDHLESLQGRKCREEKGFAGVVATQHKGKQPLTLLTCHKKNIICDSKEKRTRMRQASMQHAWERMRNTYSLLVGKSEGKRPLGKPKHRWEDNEIDVRERVWSRMNWIHLAQDR
jgi:hypothetical protein